MPPRTRPAASSSMPSPIPSSACVPIPVPASASPRACGQFGIRRLPPVEVEREEREREMERVSPSKYPTPLPDEEDEDEVLPAPMRIVEEGAEAPLIDMQVDDEAVAALPAIANVLPSLSPLSQPPVRAIACSTVLACNQERDDCILCTVSVVPSISLRR
ncbi:hypothetical protein DFH06DRAFT_68521 [Mycena polygramma]|nr:hypothetical protein DFH06DRAFT_68521 [Mycena polygramma]